MCCAGEKRDGPVGGGEEGEKRINVQRVRFSCPDWTAVGISEMTDRKVIEVRYACFDFSYAFVNNFTTRVAVVKTRRRVRLSRAALKPRDTFLFLSYFN